MWQALHNELEPLGVTVVTVALDLDPSKAIPWIEAAAPEGSTRTTNPALIDSTHSIDELLGISNVPMAVWIDESGTLVRPAEAATIEVSAMRSMEINDDLPERMKMALTEIKAMPDTAEAYRAAIIDWAQYGADSAFAMTPSQVVAASQLRPMQHSRAAALFDLGVAAHERGDHDAAVSWWKHAHELHPENWTYKRQAWTLESTPDGGPSDLAQEVGDVYGTSWLDDVIRLGGGAEYTVTPTL